MACCLAHVHGHMQLTGFLVAEEPAANTTAECRVGCNWWHPTAPVAYNRRE